MTPDLSARVKDALNPGPAREEPAPAKPAAIQLPCVCCGEPLANLSVNLWALDDEAAITCQECNAEFSLAHVRDVVGKWSKMLAWFEQAPTFPAPPAPQADPGDVYNAM